MFRYKKKFKQIFELGTMQKPINRTHFANLKLEIMYFFFFLWLQKEMKTFKNTSFTVCFFFLFCDLLRNQTKKYFFEKQHHYYMKCITFYFKKSIHLPFSFFYSKCTRKRNTAGISVKVFFCVFILN